MNNLTEVAYVNLKLDNSISKNWKYKIQKELFNLTINFTIDDWRFIRTKKYWDKIDQLNDYQKKEYTLICVKYYLKNFK
jgi:hypothetical protein